MQHPAATLARWRERPGALALRGFQHVVVAAHVTVVPPATLQPLRPRGDPHRASQLHRPRQQPQRPRRPRRRGPDLRLVARHRLPGPFRPGIIGRGHPVHRLPTQPRTQAFAQLRPGQLLLVAAVEQVAAGRHEGRQLPRQQAHGHHRRRNRHPFEPAARQFEQHRRLAFGGQQAHLHCGMPGITTGAGSHRLGAAVLHALVFQPQHETLHAAIADRQAGAQVANQSPQREQQGGMAFDLVA